MTVNEKVPNPPPASPEIVLEPPSGPVVTVSVTDPPAGIDVPLSVARANWGAVELTWTGAACPPVFRRV